MVVVVDDDIVSSSVESVLELEVFVEEEVLSSSFRNDSCNRLQSAITLYDMCYHRAAVVKVVFSE